MAGFFRVCCGGDHTKYAAVETIEKEDRPAEDDEPARLLPEQRKRLLLFVHPKRAKDTVLSASINRLRRDGHDVEVFVSQEEKDVTNTITKDMREGGLGPRDVSVAVGGSGTINEVVTAVINNNLSPDTRIAVVPMGDNTDFSSSQLFIPRNPLKALRLAATGRALPIDVGILNKTQVFMNMCTAGLALTEGEPTHCDAVARYCGIASLSTGLQPESGRRFSARGSGLGQPGTPEAEKIQEWDGNLLLLAVGNGQKTGRGMRLCPDASLGDGRLDVTYVMDAEDDKVVLLQESMSSGRLNRGLRDVVHSIRVPWLEVHSPAGMQVNCDGELVTGTDFRFEVLHQRLHMVVPDEAIGSFAAGVGHPEE